MKIIYVDTPNVKGKYLYYTDLYRSLCKITDVSTIRKNNFKLKYINGLEKSDALIFGLGWMSQKDPLVYGKVEGIRKLGIPIICMLHKPQTLLKEKLQFCKMNVDLLIYTQKEHKEYGRIAGISSMQSWMAGDPIIYKDRNIPKVYDFGFSGALHGSSKIKGKTRDLRSRIYEVIRKTSFKLFWNGSDSVVPRIKSVEQYASKINQSKIWLTTTGPLDDISPRYFEIGLSKTLIFCNKMDVYGDVFRDGENCVMFNNDLSDFNDKLIYYLNKQDKRQTIIDNAYNEFLAFHTWNNRARELVNKIEKMKR